MIQDEIDKNIGRKAYKKGNGLFSGLIGIVQKYDSFGYCLVLPNGSGIYCQLKDLVFVDENNKKPYSEEDYEKAKQEGYDLDDWNDYVSYYELGERYIED